MRVVCGDWTRLDARVQTQDRMGVKKSGSAIRRVANRVGTPRAYIGA